MTLYLATVNVPGYLPMDDDPPVFETPREAWAYLADERRDAEDYAEECTDPRHDEPCTIRSCTACQSEECGYSGTVYALYALAQPGRELAPFTVYGPTPGGAVHDLGLAYTVTIVEEGQP